MGFKYGGYAGKTLRADLTRGKVREEETSEGDCALYLGGRGMDAKTLFDEVPPDADPLGRDNVLCVSTGPVNGLLGPTTGRINVAAKSPLTNIYGNSNAGTDFGPDLKFAGYDRIIVSGRAERPVYLSVEDGRVELRSAEHLWGEGVFETTGILQEECSGYETRVAAIGPAAESGALFGSVIFDLWDAAGRTGMGTVMASKNLKAIAVTGDGILKVAEPRRYHDVARDAWEAILDDPGFRTGEHSALGTSVCVNWGNAQGWLATRNFRESVFEDADEISGEEFRDRFSARASPVPGGRACFSCPNRCKRFGRIYTGKYAGTKGSIEFEGVSAFGAKCGVNDMEAVFHAYMLSNDYGMDCITAGNVIALYMELREEGILTREDLDGVDLRFGNAEAMVEMVHLIGTGQGRLGKLGALGTERAAKEIGGGAEKYTTNVKGLETISCDPRAAKGFGFGYAVASRGSDHLRSHSVFEMIRMPEELGEELFGSKEATRLRAYGGKVKLVLWHENVAAVTDSIGSCRFMHASYYAGYPIPELRAKHSGQKGEVHSIKYHDWISAATGMRMGYEDLLRCGDRIVNLERALNVRFGVRREDDTLPKRFLKEALPTGPAKGEKFDEETLRSMVDEYYEARGWDERTGLPREDKLRALGMEDVAVDLETRGLLAASSKGGSAEGKPSGKE
jgi:aldehyde:ferredoxin oxidoreductase